MIKNAEGELLVLTAIAGAEHASVFAAGMIDQRLAACVTRIPNGISRYFWDNDKPTEESEEVLLIKTHLAKISELEKYFGEEHPYEVPEFFVFQADKISDAYAGWMKREMNLSLKGNL